MIVRKRKSMIAVAVVVSLLPPAVTLPFLRLVFQNTDFDTIGMTLMFCVAAVLINGLVFLLFTAWLATKITVDSE